MGISRMTKGVISATPQAPPEGRANYTFRHPADVKTDLGLGLGY